MPPIACDNCGQMLMSRQCKLLCGRCGARLDCSDLFVVEEWRGTRALYNGAAPVDATPGPQSFIRRIKS
jgi:hypothetical protein